MYRTSNKLSENIRSKAVELLNRHLAAAIDLRAQVKQAHWNVRGPTFIAIHELFDKVADLVEGYSDTIAERAAVLGGTAEGTVQVAVERSFHPRQPHRDPRQRRAGARPKHRTGHRRAARRDIGGVDEHRAGHHRLGAAPIRRQCDRDRRRH